MVHLEPCRFDALDCQQYPEAKIQNQEQEEVSSTDTTVVSRWIAIGERYLLRPRLIMLTLR